MQLNWDHIDTVLLDMDGTLLDLHFDNFFWQEYLPECWARQNNMEPAQAKELLAPRFRRLENTLAWYCLDHWTTELQLNVFELKNDLQHLVRLRPHVEELLANLARLNKKRFLVTNAHEKVLQYKLQLTDLGRHFEQAISSHAYGYPKEFTEFWPALQRSLRFEPSTTLLIDDNPHVLNAARSFGIGTILTIAQPDSRRPPREISEFPAIDDFRSLFPVQP